MLSQYYIRSVSPNWLEEHTGQHEKEVPFPLEKMFSQLADFLEVDISPLYPKQNTSGVVEYKLLD